MLASEELEFKGGRRCSARASRDVSQLNEYGYWQRLRGFNETSLMDEEAWRILAILNVDIATEPNLSATRRGSLTLC